MEEEIERERNVGLECRERERKTNGLNTKHRERKSQTFSFVGFRDRFRM